MPIEGLKCPSNLNYLTNESCKIDYDVLFSLLIMNFDYYPETADEQKLRERASEIIGCHKFTERFVGITNEGEVKPILHLGGYFEGTPIYTSLRFASTEKQEDEINIYYGQSSFRLKRDGAYYRNPDTFEEERMDNEGLDNLLAVLNNTAWQWEVDEVLSDIEYPKHERMINNCLSVIDEMMQSKKPRRAMLKHSPPPLEDQFHRPKKEHADHIKTYVFIGSLALGGWSALYILPLFVH